MSNIQGMGTFTVDEVVYRFNYMNPADALDFGPRVLKVVGPTLFALILTEKDASKNGEAAILDVMIPAISGMDSKIISGLIKEAISFCYTPRNEALGDEKNFNDWFIAHPDHLFTAGALAIYHLAKPFFPKMPATLLSKLQTLRATASTSPSQTGGKQ